MSFQTELFGTEKPIIGFLHLKPLPGDPLYYPGGAIASVADACGKEVRTAKVTMGACYGDALMAALGGGACASWEELVQRVGEGEVIVPDRRVYELYRGRRKMFDALYECNREDMHRL